MWDGGGKEEGEGRERKRDEKKGTGDANGWGAEGTGWRWPGKWTAPKPGWAARDKVNAVAAERRRDVRDETRTDRTGGSRNEEKKNKSEKTQKTETENGWAPGASKLVCCGRRGAFFLFRPGPPGVGGVFSRLYRVAGGTLGPNPPRGWGKQPPPRP